MTSKMHRRNFVKGSLAMLAAGQEASLAAASAQQKNQAAPPQQTRNGTARANFFPGFKSMRINTDRKSTRLIQSRSDLVCRLLLEKKNKKQINLCSATDVI